MNAETPTPGEQAEWDQYEKGLEDAAVELVEGFSSREVAERTAAFDMLTKIHDADPSKTFDLLMSVLLSVARVRHIERYHAGGEH